MRFLFLLSLFLCLFSCSEVQEKKDFISKGIEQSTAEKDSIAEENSKSLKQINKIDTLYSELDEGFVFKVSDVELAPEYLNTFPSKKVFESKVNKPIVFQPNEHVNQAYVLAHNNGFIETVQTCYDGHRPLVLSPDDIWLVICQGVSIHINENMDSLENIIFKANKPEEIVVRNDSLKFESKHWPKLISDLANETKQYTKKDYYDFFVPQFSTTTKTITTSYQIELLNSFKKVFKYVGESGCGIPSIRLKGTPNDWQKLANKITLLDEVGLGFWRKELEPILQEFLNASNHQVNVEFWQNMYKSMSDYNAYYISGWIIKLFPYLSNASISLGYDAETQKVKFKNQFYPNKFIYGEQYMFSTLSTDDFPSGIVKVDLTWNNFIDDYKKEMNLNSGFFAIKQYEDKSLEPVISWAITEDTAKNLYHDFNYSYSKVKLNHSNDEYWTPYIVKGFKKAVYKPKENVDFESGLEKLKLMLKDSLWNYFGQVDISNDTLSFVVLSNGNIENVTFSGEENEIKDVLEKQIKFTSGEWFPALADPEKVFEMWGEFVEDEKIKQIKVNSRVDIVFD